MSKHAHEMVKPWPAPALDAESAWRAILAIRDWIRRNDGIACGLSVGFPAVDAEPWVVPGRADCALVWLHADGSWSTARPPDRRAALLLDLYMPMCRAAAATRTSLVVAHLGQSLDGRIATVNGSSQWVTGSADIVHTHRMRALADAVLVGAGTVHHDDPALTVRHVPGPSPLRVVIDCDRRLDADRKVFTDGTARTLVVCAEDSIAAGGRTVGQADVLGLPRNGRTLAPSDIVTALVARGVRFLFVEGGGVTVSRFLQAACVDRLQLTVAPLLIGSGRPAISLPVVENIALGLRPRVRHFALDSDVMFECVFRD